MPESHNIEYKTDWRDEYLKTIAAFANTQGGKLILGISDDKKLWALPSQRNYWKTYLTKYQIICELFQVFYYMRRRANQLLK